ncbi:MAG: DUF134 domain-containing protein [Acetobacteraceae bacterium]|nr:DUF134 domain-containing protein [Acetobacteraceae bacterium]
MPRPPKPRQVEFVPEVTYFKPAGVPLSVLDEVCLGVDELEALRLSDLEGLGQEECAGRMNLSQSTFQRILSAAREKLTRAVVHGKAIRIEGGHYQLVRRRFFCPECGHRWQCEGPEEATPAGDLHPPAPGDRALRCPACGGRAARPGWGGGREFGCRRW